MGTRIRFAVCVLRLFAYAHHRNGICGGHQCVHGPSNPRLRTRNKAGGNRAILSGVVGWFLGEYDHRVILVAIHATSKLVNPDFYIKMVFIALAIIALQMLKTHVFRDPLIDKIPPSPKAKMLAVLSLIFWIGAITSGRLLAYVGPGSAGS